MYTKEFSVDINAPIEQVYAYGAQHYDFHRAQLTLK